VFSVITLALALALVDGLVNIAVVGSSASWLVAHRLHSRKCRLLERSGPIGAHTSQLRP
jgi:hypothetical protein